MIHPFRHLGLLAACAGAALAATPPDLQVDNSPVSEGMAGRVTSYADVVGPVLKGVVSIYTTKKVHLVNPFLQQLFGNIPGLEREGTEKGLGSGVIVTPDGYIITNNHVVEGADELTVLMSDNRKFTAKLIGTDPKTDVAVVKIDASGLPTVPLTDSDKLRVGDIVFAVGNPLEVGETVTMGIVSAKGRRINLLDEVQGYEDFIQTDASINLGNSGGALVDAKGRLVGINSAIVSPSRGSIGIGFAVPVNLAASVMKGLIATGSVTRGYLGISSDVLKDDVAEQLGLPKGTKGVIINEVTEGSPAAKAGLKAADVVEEIDGKPVGDNDDFRLKIAEKAPGEKTVLGVVREGKPITVEVTLSKLDENPGELISGVTIEAMSDDVRRALRLDRGIVGVVVTDVGEDSPFADKLAPGMVIAAIDQNGVSDVKTAKALLDRPGRHLLLIYFRGQPIYTTIVVPPKN